MNNKKVIAGMAIVAAGLSMMGVSARHFILNAQAEEAKNAAIQECVVATDESRALMGQLDDIYRPLTHHINTGIATNGSSFAHTGTEVHGLRADLESIRPDFNESVRSAIDLCMNNEPDVFTEEEVMDAHAQFDAELKDLEVVEQRYLNAEQSLSNAIEEGERAQRVAAQRQQELNQCAAIFGEDSWLFCN